jgi:predicted RNase H-like HicB family nuclease
MHNEFNAIVEKDGKWFIAYTPEVPGANGQGLTKKECLAIQLILKDRREDVMRGLPKNAIKEKIIIG